MDYELERFQRPSGYACRGYASLTLYPLYHLFFEAANIVKQALRSLFCSNQTAVSTINRKSLF